MLALLIRMFVVFVIGALNDHRIQDRTAIGFLGPPFVNTYPRLKELAVLVQKRGYGLHQKLRFEARGV